MIFLTRNNEDYSKYLTIRISSNNRNTSSPPLTGIKFKKISQWNWDTVQSLGETYRVTTQQSQQSLYRWLIHNNEN